MCAQLYGASHVCHQRRQGGHVLDHAAGTVIAVRNGIDLISGKPVNTHGEGNTH